MNYPIVLKRHGRVLVVRDDKVPGGTKARVIDTLFSSKYSSYVYASPVQGYAQVALAYTARLHGKQAVVFCARRKIRHPRTLEAIAAGAEVHEIGPAGYLAVVRARARAYAEENNALLLPFGLDVPAVKNALSGIALHIAEPREVWTVAGSGMLTTSLQAAWPNARFHAVRVGAVPSVGRATLWTAPEKYDQDARYKPPFPSCGNYDAKAWRFIVQHAAPNALFWNVAR